MSNELAIQGNNNLITIFLCKQFFICDYKIIKCFLICLKIILSLSLSLFRFLLYLSFFRTRSVAWFSRGSREKIPLLSAESFRVSHKFCGNYEEKENGGKVSENFASVTLALLDESERPGKNPPVFSTVTWWNTFQLLSLWNFLKISLLPLSRSKLFFPRNDFRPLFSRASLPLIPTYL